MTGNKRFVKKYIDEFNSEIDRVEKDILIISDELSGKIYYMDFLDDDEKEKTIDDIINNWNELNDKNEQLKKEDELFFGKVFDILLKYQDLFNREMADEVLEELGIELTKWFE